MGTAWCLCLELPHRHGCTPGCCRRRDRDGTQGAQGVHQMIVQTGKCFLQDMSMYWEEVEQEPPKSGIRHSRSRCLMGVLQHPVHFSTQEGLGALALSSSLLKAKEPLNPCFGRY